MRRIAVFLALATLALSVHPVDAGWRDRDRGDRGRGWQGRGPSCEVVRHICRQRHGFGGDYRRCVRVRGCHTFGF